MNKARSTFYVGLAGGILLLGVGLQLVAASHTQPVAEAPALHATIPAELTGWNVRELPLGETEELKNQVISTLQFDEYVSRIYTRGSTSVTVYAAYWRPNKVPPRAVGVHTPDTCWVQNGWKCTQRLRGVELPAAGSALKPAEFGIYTFGPVQEQVYFWHLVGGKPYAYEQEGLHSLTAPLKDMATFGLNQKRDQLFLRLASNVPFAQLRSDRGFIDLVEALGRLGVASAPSR